MSGKPTTCRTCRHLGVKPDAAGRVIPRATHVYPCRVPVPPLPAMPASIVVNRPACGSVRWPPTPSHMRPDDGAGCPLHEPRPKGGANA